MTARYIAPIPSLWILRERAIDRARLTQFVVLSMLLHALAIALFGAPSGGSREGRAMWGALNVVIQGVQKKEAPAIPDASKEAPVIPDASRKAPVIPDASREAPVIPDASREAIVRDPIPKPLELPKPVDLPKPAELEPAPFVMPPLLDRIEPSKTLPPLQVPPPTEVAPIPAPLPQPLPAVPESPKLPAIEAPVIRIPAETPAIPVPLLQPLPALPRAPVLPPVERAALPPVEVKPVEAPPVKPPPPVEAPPLPAPPVQAPAVQAKPPAEAPAATKPPTALERALTPPAERPSPFTRPGLPGEPAKRPEEPSTTYDPTKSAPGLDLDAMRRRAGELQRAGAGQRAVLPFPMPPVERPKSKLEDAIDKARKPDCRDAYKSLGLAAVVPLIANEFGEGTCRW